MPLADGNETFGERFTRLVEQSGASVQDVLRAVGWRSESSFYKAKRGDIKSINAKSLLRLARFLGVSPFYLMCEPEPARGAAASLDEKLDQLSVDDLRKLANGTDGPGDHASSRDLRALASSISDAVARELDRRIDLGMLVVPADLLLLTRRVGELDLQRGDVPAIPNRQSEQRASDAKSRALPKRSKPRRS